MKKEKKTSHKSPDMSGNDLPDLSEVSGQDETNGNENEAIAQEAASEGKISDEQKYNELMDKYQRTLADYDNFRKRTIKEKTVMYDDGLRDTVEKLLPIIDNFERALNAGENKEDKFYQGIEMIARQFGNYLADLGVELISSAPGEGFNHNLHFAVAHIEDEEKAANVIVDELQKGYQYKDKVIRPSMVRVAN